METRKSQPGDERHETAGTPVPRLTPHTVVDLVNEWADVPQRVSRRPWHGYPAPDSPFRQRLDQAWTGASHLEDHEIVAATGRVYEIFATPSVTTRAEILNSLVARTGLRPHLESQETTSRMTWRVPGEDDLLLASMTATMLTILTSPDIRAIGLCAATACADVYLDASPRGNRTYCSTRCQTRQRVRAHRARGC